MPSTIPRHVAIIPDGNRRWAKQEGVNYTRAYAAGGAATHVIIEEAFRSGVEYLTFWAASEDNLTKRPVAETKILLALIRRELANILKNDSIITHKVRVRVFGRFRELLKDAKVNELVRELESRTKHFSDHNLTVLLGYDGKREMVEAMKLIQRNNAKPSNEEIESSLWTRELPPVDLVIRTGGEPHSSAGFMMWLTANSELYFTKFFWPSFNAKEFQRALADYSTRRRMLGA